MRSCHVSASITIGLTFPFPTADCSTSCDFLGHVFSCDVHSDDFYDLIATVYHADLTTAASQLGFDGNPTTDMPWPASMEQGIASAGTVLLELLGWPMQPLVVDVLCPSSWA